MRGGAHLEQCQDKISVVAEFIAENNLFITIQVSVTHSPDSSRSDTVSSRRFIPAALQPYGHHTPFTLKSFNGFYKQAKNTTKMIKYYILLKSSPSSPNFQVHSNKNLTSD